MSKLLVCHKVIYESSWESLEGGLELKQHAKLDEHILKIT